MLSFRLSIPAAILALVSTLAITTEDDLFQLTSDSFDTETANGYLFIEFLSPYSMPCQRFLPTWVKLVKVAREELPEVRLAQVNCVEHGDLCEKKGISRYPTILLFKDGKRVENDKGKRKLPDLMRYLNNHVHKGSVQDEHEEPQSNPYEGGNDDAVSPPSLEFSSLNPSGEVIDLDGQTFNSALARGLTFVNFCAFWSGHCKKLAPRWARLANELRGQVQVAQVECDVEEILCKAHAGRGYPSLVYFSHGYKLEFSGARELQELKAFAEKPFRGVIQPISDLSELEARVTKEQVVYLLIHSSDQSIVDIARQDAVGLFGSPSIYTSSAAALRKKYAVGKHVPWALIALKDHNIDTPTGFLLGTSSTTRAELKKWLLSNRLPGYFELTRDTLQTMMDVPHSPFVVIAPSNDKLESKIVEKVVEMSKAWREKTNGTGVVVGGREVVWAWNGNWMQSTYGLGIGEEDELEDVKVVVASPKESVYWNQGDSGQPFTLASPTPLYEALLSTIDETSGDDNFEGAAEPLVLPLYNQTTGLKGNVVGHAFQIMGILVGGLAVVVWVSVKWAGSVRAHSEKDDSSSKRKNKKSD